MQPQSISKVNSAGQSNESPDTRRYQPPTFNLQFLFLSATLAAIWSAGLPWLSWYSLGVLAAMLLTFLMGCRRTRLAVATIGPTMILPYAWIFWDRQHPWDDYRRLWAGMLFELPGMISMVILRLYVDTSVYERLLAAITCAVLFLLFVLAGRVNRNWLLATIFLALNLSIANSYMMHALFAM